MIYKIFPPLGIARVGNSRDQFFIGPESPGSLGTEVLADNVEAPVIDFKDATFRMKRQAARFRLFEFDEGGGPGRPAALPAGSQVRWTVTIANMKDAVIRADSPVTEKVPLVSPPELPRLDAARANRVIGAQAIVLGALSHPAMLQGTYLTGTPLEEPVVLGEVRTDAFGNLLVLGGFGISRSPENKPIGEEVVNGESGGGFYNNRGWYDDVSDGIVSAEIKLPQEAEPRHAESAWVVVAPPDFAPATEAVVTLYDVLLQVAIERGDLSLPQRPSFSRDIWPLLRRAAGLVWVNSRPGSPTPSFWSRFKTNWRDLADASSAAEPLRRSQAELLRSIGPQRRLANFSLRSWQQDYLSAWERGNFDSDFDGAIPGAGVLSPENLTRAALDSTAGQGFFQGSKPELW